MADIPNSAEFTQIEETRYPFPTSESVLQKIGGTINYILDELEKSAIGEVQESMLTETQFQTLMGTGWILADGRNVVGSKYQVITGNGTVPDCRGLFLRAQQGNRVDIYGNPDGNLPLGTYQQDSTASHAHTATRTGTNLGFTDNQQVSREGISGKNVDGQGAGLNVTLNPTTENEDRPLCVTVNIFIKIN